jgi:hypothetical protein
MSIMLPERFLCHNDIEMGASASNILPKGVLVQISPEQVF